MDRYDVTEDGMTQKRFGKIVQQAALAVSTCLFIYGCGLEGGSTAPGTGGVTGQFIRIPESERAQLAVYGTSVAPLAEKTISAKLGGTVSLGRITLTFPPGALSVDTPISISLTDPNTLQVELQPHGLQFHRPVTLVADLTRLVSPASHWVGVAWWNESETRWDEISRQPAAGVATAELWHFSTYVQYEE